VTIKDSTINIAKGSSQTSQIDSKDTKQEVTINQLSPYLSLFNYQSLLI